MPLGFEDYLVLPPSVEWKGSSMTRASRRLSRLQEEYPHEIRSIVDLNLYPSGNVLAGLKGSDLVGIEFIKNDLLSKREETVAIFHLLPERVSEIAGLPAEERQHQIVENATNLLLLLDTHHKSIPFTFVTTNTLADIFQEAVAKINEEGLLSDQGYVSVYKEDVDEDRIDIFRQRLSDSMRASGVLEADQIDQSKIHPVVVYGGIKRDVLSFQV